VSLERARRKKSRQLELPLEAGGEAPQGQRSGEAPTAVHGNGRSGTDRLMEREVMPMDQGIADTHGWIYYQKKVYLKALSLLEGAAQKLPDNPLALHH
jgi:hypothetical protein